jgi:hypothetical protein
VLGGEADAGEHRAAAVAPLGARERGVDRERLLERHADLLARIEARERVLEHHLHVLAQRAPRRCVGGGRVDAGDDDAAGGRRLEHRDLARQRALAAARFADDGERARRSERERDLLERAHRRALAEHACRHGIVLLQAMRLEHPRRCRRGAFARLHGRHGCGGAPSG